VLSLLQPAGTWSARHARFVTALLVLVFAGGSAEMARVPHFVTFTDPHAVPEPYASIAIADSQSPVPVVYHPETAQPRATLLKAAMPSAPRVSPTLQPLSLRKAHAMKQRRHSRMPHAAAAVSAAGRANPYRGRLVQAFYVLPNQFSPSYAAIRFADGWLIVQL